MTERNQSMTLDEILRLALAKERRSHQFYGNMLEKHPAEIGRELLERLKDEEYKHIHLIEAMIAKLEMGRGVV